MDWLQDKVGDFLLDQKPALAPPDPQLPSYQDLVKDVNLDTPEHP